MARYDLEIDGIEWWVPIRLDLSYADRVAELQDRIPSVLPTALEYLGQAADLAIMRADQSDSSQALALWARIPPDRRVPDLTANLTLMSLAGTVTVASVADSIYATLDHARPSEFTEVETASGPAVLLDALLAVPTDDGDQDLVSQLAVIWIAENGDVLVLLATTTDLVLLDEVKPELAQLASGVRGFR